MSELLDFKCPSCGGSIEFNSSSQNMKCPYCGSEFDVETVKHMMNSHRKIYSGRKILINGQAKKLKVWLYIVVNPAAER